MKKNIVIFCIFILLSMFSIWPLLNSGYFPMHDDTQVARVVTMGRALQNGQFPVRWVSYLGYGYGYPIFNFYGPFPYYVGGVLYAAGMSGLLATKVMMISGMLLAGASMFLLGTVIVGPWAGLTAGILTVYAPYHATQLYVRGAIGELWVLVFLPLLLLGIYFLLLKVRKSVGILTSVIGLSGVITSHTIFGFTTVTFFAIALFMLFVMMFVGKMTKDVVLSFFVVFALSLGLTASFWLPAVSEMKYTVVSQQIGPSAQIKDHFICLSQFWYSPWGFGGSSPGCSDGLSFALGKAYIAFTAIGLGVLIFAKNDKNIRLLGYIGSVCLFFSLFFMLNISLPVWNILPGFSYVQYPWRFLVYTIVGMSVTTIVIFARFHSELIKIVVATGICFTIIVVNIKLFIPQYLYQRSPEQFETDSAISFYTSKISDEYLPQSVPRPDQVSDVTTSLITQDPIFVSKTIVDRETYKKIEFLSKTDKQILLHIADFPGWKYIVNGKEQEPVIDHGRPLVTIPKDFSTLEVRFTNTAVRSIGNVISLITVVLLGYYYGKKTIR